MICGIYQITNILNNKFYVGSSYNIEGRVDRHFKALERHCHYNRYMQRTFDKYGDVFEVVVVLICDRDNLLSIEQRFLDYYWDSGILYNLSPTAGSGFGIKWSDESKRKHSVLMSKRQHSSAAKYKMSQALLGNTRWLGKKHSEETKIKMKKSPWNTGKTLSEEHKKKLHNALLGNTHLLGHVHTEEHKKKISLANIGRSNPNKGNTISEELRKKLSELQSGEKNGFYGKRHSEETREKMRLAWQKRKLNKS